MKKIILLFILSTFSQLGFSQYVHFPDSNAVWFMAFFGTEICSLEGDTSVNNISYKKFLEISAIALCMVF